VIGSQPAGDVSHKPECRPPVLSTRPAVTPATLERAATQGWVFAMAKTIFAGTVEKTGKNRGKN